MKVAKIAFILPAIILLVFAGFNLSHAGDGIGESARESIAYIINPFGRTECNYLGVVDLNGKKVNLITIRIKVFMLEDREKIYSDPESSVVYKIERNISRLWGKEYVTEEYDQEKFIVTIRSFKKGKLVKEKVIKENGPIRNLLLLPFYLSKCLEPDLGLGWQLTERVPGEFKLELASVDDIIVPAGKFHAYHFKSIPERFEIWINKNSPRVPLKIKIRGTFNLSFVMKNYKN